MRGHANAEKCASAPSKAKAVRPINVAVFRPNTIELILGLLTEDPCMHAALTENIYNAPPLLHVFLHFYKNKPKLEVLSFLGLP